MRSKKISRKVAEDIKQCRGRIDKVQVKGLEGMEAEEINSIMREIMENFSEVASKVRSLKCWHPLTNICITHSKEDILFRSGHCCPNVTSVCTRISYIIFISYTFCCMNGDHLNRHAHIVIDAHSNEMKYIFMVGLLHFENVTFLFFCLGGKFSPLDVETQNDTSKVMTFASVVNNAGNAS